MTVNNPPKLGILMLDTRFPRIKGDVGNPATWDFPVRYKVVAGATPDAIVNGDTRLFVEAFVKAGGQLADEGCTGIATTCGFLALIRPELAQQIGVPVAASALEQAAQIKATLAPSQQVGVLTISRPSLSMQHLAVAGVPKGSVIAGVQKTQFAKTILGNHDILDVELARSELVEAAVQFVKDAPQIGAILLECTNMPPYAQDIARATGRPVYSIYTYLKWFHESLAPAPFQAR